MVFRRRDKISLFQQAKQSLFPKKGWKRPFSYIFLRVKRRPGTPEFIAKGFAIGIFVSFSPFIGVHVLGAIGIAWIFSADAIAAMIGTLIITMPMNFGIIFPLSYRIGKAFMGLRPNYTDQNIDSFQELFDKLRHFKNWREFLHVFWELLLPMTIGGVLLGGPVALICYFVVKKAVQIFRTQRDHLRQAVLQHRFKQAEHDIETPVEHTDEK